MRVFLDTNILLDVLLERDFEDVVQATCAARGGCDCLITHNEKDFHIRRGLSDKVKLPPVLTPAAFLRIQ